MAEQVEKAELFASLHKKGGPIIIYNAWDGGSARVIAEAGAKAIATGDHPVGFSHGYTNENFDGFSFENYLTTITDIARTIDLPFSVDISSGEGLDDDGLQGRVRGLLELGVVGVNFEDRLEDSSGVREVGEQARRIALIRSAASDFGVHLFINARTDLFATSEREPSELLDEAIERAKAYQLAGASGFFAPGLSDLSLIEKLCSDSPLPVNIIRLPGTPSAAELKSAGVSRISYGPTVQMQMSEWLLGKAKHALAGND